MAGIRGVAVLGVAWLGLVACGPGGGLSADGEETGEAGSTSHNADDGETGGPNTTEDGDADDTAGDTDATGETGDTGETGGPDVDGVELLVYRYDAAGWLHFFRFRFDGETADGPTLAHEDGPAHWTTATPLSDHRVAYTLGNSGGSELRLASLDDPLPATTVGIDEGAPRGPGAEGWPLPIPGSDALLYGNDDRLYRVELDDLEAEPPVLLTQMRQSTPFLDRRARLDPAGRYVVVQQPEHGDSETSLARVSLQGADAGAVEVLTPTTPGTTATLPELLPSGDGAFYADYDGGVSRLMYVALADGGADPVAVSDGLTGPDGIDWYFPHQVEARPHDDAPGMVVWVGEMFDHELRYYGLDAAGDPLPPVTLHNPAVTNAARNARWAPDGRTLSLELDGGSTHSLWVAQFGDGQEPELSLLAEFSDVLGTSYGRRWAPDGRHLYVERSVGAQVEIVRYEMRDDGPGPAQVIGGPYQSVSLWGPSPDSRTLLFSARNGEEIELWAVDVSREEPADPVVLNAPLAPGCWAQFPEFSPDGRYVAYSERSDILDDETLMLVPLDAPGEAIEVTEAMIGFQFVPLVMSE